jgi:hypothetical protein
MGNPSGNRRVDHRPDMAAAHGRGKRMNEKQIIKWLGFKPDDDRIKGKQLNSSIIVGMAGVPDPTTGAEQYAAFRAFLRCAPIPEKAIFKPIMQKDGK